MDDRRARARERWCCYDDVGMGRGKAHGHSGTHADIIGDEHTSNFERVSCHMYMRYPPLPTKKRNSSCLQSCNRNTRVHYTQDLLFCCLHVDGFVILHTLSPFLFDDGLLPSSYSPCVCVRACVRPSLRGYMSISRDFTGTSSPRCRSGLPGRHAFPGWCSSATCLRGCRRRCEQGFALARQRLARDPRPRNLSLSDLRRPEEMAVGSRLGWGRSSSAEEGAMGTCSSRK